MEKITGTLPKVSVIIPVYNAETYLEEALRSAASQTLSPIEFICINDCSQDNSLRILNEFARRDPRFFIHTNDKNLGVGLSRNKGIELAKGEYIGFMDNDDLMDPDIYTALYQEAKTGNYDMVRCNVHVHENGEVKSGIYTSAQPKGSEKLRKEMLSLLLYQFPDDPQPTGLWMSGVWNKIYKRELLIRHQISFYSEREYPNEDFLFNLNVLLNTHNLSYITPSLYHHYNRPNSLGSANYYYKRYKRVIATCEMAESKIVNGPLLPEEVLNRLYYRACTHLPTGILNEWKRNPEGFGEAWKEIKAICNHPFTRKAISQIQTERLMSTSGKSFYPLFAGFVLRWLKLFHR